MHFCRLENILGIWKATCMFFQSRHIELRQLFWKTLYKEIEINLAVLESMALSFPDTGLETENAST
jgi:hypothetical protein